MTQINQLKVAIVHDWLTGMRGGEKVLEAFLHIFPNAELFTLLYNPGSVSSLIEDRKIHSSFINKLPFKSTKYRHYLPLFPTAIELFNFKGYDLVLSSSHCVAKGVRIPPGTIHISYIHSPMRYVWDMYEEYFGQDKVGIFGQITIPFFANYLRIWDTTSSNRVDFFIANSKHVANRIKKYYRRGSEIIHPPVNTQLYQLSHRQKDFYLIVSALVPYKKVDLAIQAFNQLEKPLYIIGEGPEKSRLVKMAKSNIKFINWLSCEELAEYYSNCRALIFPGEEDFGIVPVEAQSCGKPVIAYAKGGALETIIGYDSGNENKCTGIFYTEQNSEALTETINTFETLEWNTKFIHQQAQKFSTKHFIEKMNQYISNKVNAFFE